MRDLSRILSKFLSYWIVALSLFLLPTVAMSFSVTEKDTASLYGLIECSSPKNDSMTVKFDMAYYGPTPDSIGFCIFPFGSDTLPSQVTFLSNFHPDDTVVLYRAGDALPLATDWYKIRMTNRLRLNGAFALLLSGTKPEDLWIEFVAFVGSDKSKWAERGASLDRGVSGGLCLNTFVPGLGVYESDKEEPGKKTGFLAAYTFGVSWGDPHTEWTLLTSWSGLGKNFSFSVPLQLRASYFPFERYHWSPFILGGGNLSKVKVNSDIGEYRKVEWGGEIGLGITDGLDRLTGLAPLYATLSGGQNSIPEWPVSCCETYDYWCADSWTAAPANFALPNPFYPLYLRALADRRPRNRKLFYLLIRMFERLS